MQRFYIKKKLEDIEILKNERFHQISRVLRMKIADEVILFSDVLLGSEQEGVYEIMNFSKDSVTLKHKYWMSSNIGGKNDCNIVLYQALPNKLEKIEWIIQKNIEIGVSKIVFFRSERSQKLIISDNKKQRFGEIAREALEQCGGIRFPEIIFSYEKSIPIEKGECEKNITLHTGGGEIEFANVKGSKNIGIWVGPEGGWTDNEIKEMNRNGFIIARFGERVFRTETAGMLMVFGVLYG